jgi:hypothetical protein
MSLWLGISAIDLKIIFKILVNYLEKILLKVILTTGLNKYFAEFIDFMIKFIFYVKKFKKLYLQKFLNLFILICFFYQSIELTLEFTAFKTTIEVELDFYRDRNGSIKLENLPAFSFCFESTNLYDTLKHYKNSKVINQYKLSEKLNKLLTNKSASKKLRQKQNLIPNEAKNISNYLLFLNYSMPFDMMCQSEGPNVTTECFGRDKIILSESYLGKCYTYLSGLIDSKYDEKLINSREFINLGSFLNRQFRGENYYRIIHDRNQLPSLVSTHMTVYEIKFYSLIKVKRLPPPYDSNCFNYKTNGLVKSRGHCINYCIINKIVKKYNCIPENMLQILTLFDNISLNAMFCSEVKVDFFEEETYCRENCLKHCEESLFKIVPDRFQDEMEQMISPDAEKYVIYINKIYMTFINFMISFGGLLGLWNNVSIYDLQLRLLKFVEVFIDYKIMKIFSKLLIFKKLIDSIKKFFIRINSKVNAI